MLETELLTTTHKKDLKMKSILMLVIIGLATTQAQAIGSLNLDFRADMLSQTYNDAAEHGITGTTPPTVPADLSNYRFVMQTARLDYKGTMGDTVSYRARIRFATRPQGAMEVRDNSNPTVDMAFATHKMSDMIKLTVGKFAIENGGFEGNSAGADLYLTSESYAGTGTVLGSTAGVGYKGYANQFYQTGAKVAFTLDTHEVALMASNLDLNSGRAGAGATANATAGLSTQNKSLLGLVYKGSIMDKTLSFIASYHGQTVKEDFKNNWIAAGVQWNLNPILAQLDYSLANNSFVAGTTNFKDELSSIVGKVVYSVDENLGVGVKVISSEEKLDGTTAYKNKYMSYGLQAEYKPVAADMYRYHIALNSREMTPDSNLAFNDKRNLQEIIVGMRINGDFLK